MESGSPSQSGSRVSESWREWRLDRAMRRLGRCARLRPDKRQPTTSSNAGMAGLFPAGTDIRTSGGDRGSGRDALTSTTRLLFRACQRHCHSGLWVRSGALQAPAGSRGKAGRQSVRRGVGECVLAGAAAAAEGITPCKREGPSIDCFCRARLQPHGIWNCITGTPSPAGRLRDATALGCILLALWLSKEKPQYFTRPPK